MRDEQFNRGVIFHCIVVHWAELEDFNKSVVLETE